jgi:hypothetical protein
MNLDEPQVRSFDRLSIFYGPCCKLRFKKSCVFNLSSVQPKPKGQMRRVRNLEKIENFKSESCTMKLDMGSKQLVVETPATVTHIIKS